MFWKIYFVLNCILLGLVTITVLFVESGLIEKLSLIAGLISVLGLYVHSFKSVDLPTWFWAIGLVYVVIVGFVGNVLVIFPQYPDMTAWEPFLYFGLILFHFPTYYIFFKHSKSTVD